MSDQPIYRYDPDLVLATDLREETSRMRKFIAHSSNVMQALHEAGVIANDPREVKRVVLDFQAGSVAVAYVQLFVDDRIIDVILEGGLKIEERGP